MNHRFTQLDPNFIHTQCCMGMNKGVSTQVTEEGWNMIKWHTTKFNSLRHGRFPKASCIQVFFYVQTQLFSSSLNLHTGTKDCSDRFGAWCLSVPPGEASPSQCCRRPIAFLLFQSPLAWLEHRMIQVLHSLMQLLHQVTSHKKVLKHLGVYCVYWVYCRFPTSFIETCWSKLRVNFKISTKKRYSYDLLLGIVRNLKKLNITNVQRAPPLVASKSLKSAIHSHTKLSNHQAHMRWLSEHCLSMIVKRHSHQFSLNHIGSVLFYAFAEAALAS